MRALGRAVADPAAHLIAVTGGTAAELPGIAAELTGSFHRTADAGAPLRPGAAALLAALERHRVPFALVSASPYSARRPSPSPSRPTTPWGPSRPDP
ncbi:hypothetical protein ACFXKK_28815 [Streptomyces globisporus]|uniref:hypothetical protein n=1 Tax=Streptomyces globisporus TaxID=1908 RepID=UPI003646EC2D